MEGGWINPDAPSKRQRLNNSGDDNANRSANQRHGHDTVASGSDAVSSLSQSVVKTSTTTPTSSFSFTSRQREDCRYGITCYRRNESHLLQYRHKLLEDAFRLMTKANNFAKFPVGLSLENGDVSAILEQAEILRDAGFQSSPTHPMSESDGIVRRELNDKITKKSVVEKTTRPNESFKDSVASLQEERRLKYQEKKRASQLIEKQRSENDQKASTSSISVSLSKGNMAEKWKASCPFNIFLTKVREVPVEKDNVLSAGFIDLFDESLGTVKALCHINFMVEANWLFDQTVRAGLNGKPTWIIYGDDNTELKEAAKAFPSLKLFAVKSPFPFGHHHTKMTIVQYEDHSTRFMIYTANLVESDWDNRTQGIWISPKCPKAPSGSSSTVGESPTNFRSDILQYLSTYPVQATAAWKDVIKTTDCSDIKVYFIGSAPITSQSSLNGFQFGLKKMEKILRAHEMETEPNWHLTIQCSSIGTLGATADDWLINEFGAAMAGKDRCIRGPVNLVYPSNQNVKDSFDGILGGGCLPYSARTHMKQKWLGRHFCQWKAHRSGRTRAPPHIKSYFRCSPDQKKVAWFLLTSANLSKAAWGKVNKNGDRLSVMSWEAGVLFIPEILINSKYFAVNSAEKKKLPEFPFYFDIPLVKYEKKDTPWYFETLQLAFCDSD